MAKLGKKQLAKYEEIEKLWGAQTLPKLTDKEAERAACRLYRFGMGETFFGSVKFTSGNRYSNIERAPIRSSYDGKPLRGGVLVVNADEGWNRLVHSLSHSMFYRANPDARPHDREHAGFELKLVKEVIKRGWLDGKLRDEPKPEPAPADVKLDKLARIDARVEAWERKAKRAATALAKLHKQRKATVRAMEKAAAA
jgi:hypothetical protein